MKNLYKLFNECKLEITNCGYDTGCVRMVKSNTRFTRRLGQTSIVDEPYSWDENRRRFDIEISEKVLADDYPTIYTKEIILHELIHTLPGCFNHGEHFKAVARTLNMKYGYNISRVASSSSVACLAPQEHKYEIQCPVCGKIFYRDRMSDFVKNPQDYRHHNCNKELVRIK